MIHVKLTQNVGNWLTGTELGFIDLTHADAVLGAGTYVQTYPVTPPTQAELDAASAAAITYNTAHRYILGSEFDAATATLTTLTPGPGQLVVGGADGTPTKAASPVPGEYRRRVLSIQTAALLGYWPLNEAAGAGAIDRSPKSAHGVRKSETEPGRTTHYPFTMASFDGVDDYVNLYSTGLQSAFNPSAGTLMCWCRPADGVLNDAVTRRLVYLAADSSNRVYIQKPNIAGGQFDIGYQAGGTNSVGSIGGIVSYGLTHVAVTWDKTANQVKVYRNGIQSGATLTGLGTWAGTLAPTTSVIGADSTAGGNPWQGEIGHVALWNVALSPTDIALLAAPDTFGLRGQVIFEGDSLTVGLQNGAVPYPAHAMQALGDGWITTSIATSSETVAQMTSEAPGTDLLLSAAVPQNILVLLGGTNDIAAGDSATTVYGRIHDYGVARRAAGWRIIACTLLPSTVTAGFNAVRNAVNTLIRANWQTFADGLADLAADPTVGPDGAEQSPTYFQPDHLHLTTAGYAIVAGIVKPVIASLA